MISVGEMLKQTREKKGLSLSNVAKEICIREKFLKAVENNDWNNFSSKIYISGIIKNYAKILGLDHKKALAFFNSDYEKKEDIRFKKKVSGKYLAPETKKYFFGILFFLVSLFVAYFVYQLNLYMSPPKVEIISPRTAYFKKEEKIKIIGKTDKEATVNIFNERIYQNKDGLFEYEMPLQKGRNPLIIEVVGANGKKTSIKKDFFME